MAVMAGAVSAPSSTVSATGQTFDVATAQELQAALVAASAGDTIRLAAGNYGDLYLNANNGLGDGITFVSADVNAPAVFHSIDLANRTNVKFAGIAVDFLPDQNTVRWDNAVRVTWSSDVTFVDCTVKGGPAVNGVPPTATTLDATGNVLGLPTGNGFSFQNSRNVTVSATEISEFFAGIQMSNVDGMRILDNEIHHLRTTPIRGGNVNNLEVSGNYTHTSTPWNLSKFGDHGDFLHLWTDPALQNTGNRNISIFDNFFSQGSGAALLGIYLDDNGNGLGFSGVLIENNVLLNGDHQGVRFENVDGAVIRSNTFLQSSGTPNDAPGVILTSQTRNTVVENNILAFVANGPTGASGTPPYSTNAFTNNFHVQRHYEDRPGYYGDLFVDALAPVASLYDLQALPGSVIETLGVGAAATLFQGQPGTLAGIIQSKAETGISSLVGHFDASMLFGPTGLIDTSAATVTWDFGDGETGTGLLVDHAFRKAGSYTVTATLTLPDGRVAQVDRTVVVTSPVLLETDFRTDFADRSDSTNAVTVNGGVATVSSLGETAVALNGGRITYDATRDMFDNDEYTVAVDFRKTATGEKGMLVSFPGSFTLSVDGNGLVASVSTTLGTSWVKAYGLPINDLAWHKMALVFSGKDGTATIYLDGTRVAEISGLSGAIQRGNTTHDVHLGNPSGAAFGGHVANPLFVAGALDAAELAAMEASARGARILDHLGRDPTPGRATDEVLVLTAGDDSAAGQQGEDILIGLAGNDTLRGDGGQDFLEGQDGSDRIFGGTEDDRVYGGAGGDRLSGDEGADDLFGLGGNDRLDGGAGRDWIHGGQGNDTLTGGADADIYVLGDGHGHDRITDFETGIDRIRLTGHAAVADFGDLTFLDTANGVVIGIGSDSLTLAGIVRANLQVTDFVF